jgi:DNA-binding YbaB/EbfC family protein
MKNFNQILKQAQQLQTKMQDAQEKAKLIELDGSSGGGMVSVKMNGKNQVLSVKIDKSLVNSDEIEVLEDLLTAAFNDASAKISQAVSDEMEKVTGGLNLPSGIKLPF